MSFETTALSNECASPDVFNRRKKEVFAVRDFPTGCGCQRISSGRLNSLVEPEDPSSTDDSEPKDKSIVPFKKEEFSLATKAEVLEIFLQDSLDNARMVTSLKTSVSQTSKLPDASIQKRAKVCPPRGRFSATRYFPQGCGRQAPQTAKVPEGSTGLEIYGKDDKNTEQVEGARSDVLQGNSGCLEIKKEKIHQNDNDKCLGAKLAGPNSMKMMQRIPPTRSEFPRNLVIVQALMAAPSCPWRQRKRRAIPKLITKDDKTTPQKYGNLQKKINHM